MHQHPWTFLLSAVALATTLWTLLSIVALARRHRTGVNKSEPPITILKPLRGVDSALEANLRSFFEQDYPRFDIVFGVEGAADPVLPLLERLRAQYPHVPTRLVVHEGGGALNPKVRNLLAMLSAGAHDVVVISDANIRVTSSYLRRAVATLEVPGTGLVTHPIAGVGDDTWGARVEQSYLSTQVIAGIAVSQELLGHAAVIGKSMMFRRSTLDRLGGLESLSNVLAEDYVMGRMFQHGGYRVALADDAVINTCAGGSLSAAWDRMVRWSMLRARVQPLAYVLEPVSSPLMILGMSPLLFERWLWPAAAALLLMSVRDAAAARRVGHRLRWDDVALSPLRELMWLSAWFVALGRRHVEWRGRRLRVSAGTRLYQVPENGATR